MPLSHLKFKEIPLFKDPAEGEEGVRKRVGTAVIVNQDATQIDFFVRIDDPEQIADIREALTSGVYFNLAPREYDDPNPKVHEARVHVIPEQLRNMAHKPYPVHIGGTPTLL